MKRNLWCKIKVPMITDLQNFATIYFNRSIIAPNSSLHVTGNWMNKLAKNIFLYLFLKPHDFFNYLIFYQTFKLKVSLKKKFMLKKQSWRFLVTLDLIIRIVTF